MLVFLHKKSFPRKKDSVKFYLEMPIVPTGQNFLPKYNVAVFAQKLVDDIYIEVRKTNGKINWKKK